MILHNKEIHDCGACVKPVNVWMASLPATKSGIYYGVSIDLASGAVETCQIGILAPTNEMS